MNEHQHPTYGWGNRLDALRTLSLPPVPARPDSEVTADPKTLATAIQKIQQEERDFYIHAMNCLRLFEYGQVTIEDCAKLISQRRKGGTHE